MSQYFNDHLAPVETGNKQCINGDPGILVIKNFRYIAGVGKIKTLLPLLKDTGKESTFS